VQERKFVRTDSGEDVSVNIRLIASSSQDLADAVRVGTFDGELLDHLAGFTIYLPPLRERKADILLLAEHFLEKYEIEHNKNVKRISTPAIDMLTAYHYPGNVRELENVIERSVLVCDSNVIHGHHLPPTLQTAEVSGTETRVTLASAVEAFERDLIIDTLKSTRGNVAKAAKMLDSTERILGYKIVKYEIDRKRFRR
nr:sigma-54-dependent Fis family transcriptional regulator [Pyrinomonadaceae bacterium]